MLSTLFVRMVEPELESLEVLLGMRKKIKVDYITGNTYLPVHKTHSCPVCGEQVKNSFSYCDPRPEEL